MLTEKIQALVNRHVEGSPRARQLLAQLEGRSMQVVARYTPWQVLLTARDGKLQLSRKSQGNADVALTGSPLALLSMLKEDAAEVIRRGDVTLSGDAELATRFQELLALLRPDLEAELAGIVGDIPAYGAGSLLRKAMDFSRHALHTQAMNAGEYLAHEKKVLVPRTEADAFLREVDALREQTDRVAARVAALESRGTP